MPAIEPFDRRPDRTSRGRRVAKWAVLAAGVVVFLVQWAHVAMRPRGDFHLHWKFGGRLAAGEFIYAGSLNCPYPPFWALAHAPLTVLPLHTAQIVVFPLCAVALAALLWTLARLTREHLPGAPDLVFWRTVLAVALASRFLVRDMLECGVNLALVAAAWLAVVLWTRRRDTWAGVVLGAAIALKCTPGLFLAWFLWKRQWKVAVAAAATTGALLLAPALWMGTSQYADAMGYWLRMASRGSGADPSQGVLGPEPLQNISLRAALGRYLMHLPEGHPGRIDHPLYVDLVNLPPAAAGWCAKIAVVLLVSAVAWSFRGRATDRRDPALLWECAGVSLLILLVSPITWGQHCVGVLPVLYLLSRSIAAGRPVPGWMRWTVVAYAVLILGLNRALLGKELSWLLDSYHVTTWCVAGLLAIAVGGRMLMVPWDERRAGAVVDAAGVGRGESRVAAVPGAHARGGAWSAGAALAPPPASAAAADGR